jgi:hypothetical protein
MKRTDVHSPSNLVTEDYEFVGCGNHATAELDSWSPMPAINRMIEQGYRFNDVHGGHHCSHCGSFLVYYAVLAHRPSKTMIHVGETCLDNRFELATSEFHRLRKQAKLNRERAALREKRATFLDQSDNQALYAWAKEQPAYRNDSYCDEESFEAKFVRFIDKYGDASDKFVASIRRSRDRQAEWAAKRAEEAKTAKPVIEGRTRVRGEVLSAKGKDTPYGWTLKLLIKDEGGFKVYGNAPSAIDSVERGDVVEFVATVKASDDDPTFGFYSRPTGASIIQRKEQV